MRKILLVALAATALFSCSKESVDNSTEKGNASLYMSVKKAETKTAENTGGSNGGYVTSLYVQLVDGSGVQFGSAYAAPSAFMDALSGGTPGNADNVLFIEKVPQNAAKVIAYGFKAASAPAGFDLSNYDGTKVINNLQGEFADVPFFNVSSGSYTATEINKDNATQWKTTTNISPYFARFEITGAPKAGSGINSISVSEVYINNFNATHGASALTAYVGNGAHFIFDASHNITGTTGGGSGSDEGDWGTNPYTSSGAASKMYDNYTSSMYHGYNLYAQSSMPQVVLKVSVTTDNSNTFTGFVTIGGFKDATNTAVSAIEIGKLYKLGLGEFTINISDVDPEPNHETADLHMTITVTDWEEVEITPNM